MKKLTVLAVALVVALLAYYQEQRAVDVLPAHDDGRAFAQSLREAGSGSNAAVEQAIEQQRRDVQLKIYGVVSKTLSDDNSGSRHQRFIVALPSGHTVLVAHNIDLAERIPDLQEGDSVELYGEYVWNSRGGVMHWTHRDPAGHHVAGWIKHNNRLYQ
jgi:Protein of unknown function (DUF3465)